jgi:ATP-dependent DNA helicase RecG
VEDEVVRDASVADLDRRLVRRYLAARLPDRGVRVAAALRDLGWVDSRERPRLAAMLMFGRRPQRDNRRFGVDLLRFAGARGRAPALRERIELHGPIPLLVEQAQRTIDDRLRSDAVVRGLVREELPAYPPVVVREALLNATAHRDYAARGSAVQVRIYDDALEIESPGTLPAYVTVETLREAQYSRNERIMDALQRLGLVEEAGQGVDRMFAEMEAAFLEPPEFAERTASFVVTLRARTSLPAEDRLWIARFAGLGLTADARTALVHVHRRGSISNEELRALRELDREASRRTLQELVARGLLERVGERRGTRYVLGLATRRAKSAGLDARLRVVMRHAQRHGAVVNADVRTLLEVDRTAARKILSELVALGRLRPVGERRGRRYLPVVRGDER